MSALANGPKGWLTQAPRLNPRSWRAASLSAASSANFSEVARAATSPFNTMPSGSSGIKCARSCGWCTTSQANSPRSGSTGWPSKPCSRASTLPSGKPPSRRFDNALAARNSAMLRWRGAAQPATVVNTLLAKAARASLSGKASGKSDKLTASCGATACSAQHGRLLSNSTAHSRPASSSSRSMSPG